MTRQEVYNSRSVWFRSNWLYELTRYNEFDYSILNKMMYIGRSGKGDNTTYNDVVIMLDTETSKSGVNATVRMKDGSIKYIPITNYVVAWTISIRAFGLNICTLYGNNPEECIECVNRIHNSMSGHNTIIYVHNLAYDWVFLRKFMFTMFGHPISQLNTKPHYPIYVKFDNGIIFKDSLILAQRSLDKWSKDLGVDHQKALGKWEYDLIRHQDHIFTSEELEYIEHDTLAGVECLDYTMRTLNKHIYSFPYTATGIPREQVRKLAKAEHFRDKFLKIVLTFEQQLVMELVYHGGYTHANRHMIEQIIIGIIRAYDFASSYPYCMLSERFPMGKFCPYRNMTIDEILRLQNNNAFIFKLILVKPRLKSDDIPMPSLQFSKCIRTLNPVQDNGRILCAEYIEIYTNEIDLNVIASQYDYEKSYCVEVQFTRKDYLPRWFTDYIFKCFEDKTKLKGMDKVLYSIAKAKLNSLYGMCVQKPIKDNIEEDYSTGAYESADLDPKELYEKYLNNHNSILPYQWGVWVTSYAFRNLFELGSCAGTWIYSDTDSCYGMDWDEDKVQAYNQKCKDKLKANGYGCVYHNNREYWLGVAETSDEDVYSEFKVMGAKRYCGRCTADNELHITVAGVPKSGVKCLNNDIKNFTSGAVFDGLTTNKKMHTYTYIDDIYTNEHGDIVGDSIDLNPCDYLLDSVNVVNWQEIFEKDIDIQVYQEEE